MSALDTWMPLYVADYQKDTHNLTLEQSGAYLHLLMRYWTSGSLPDDDTNLSAILGVSRTHFTRHLGPALRPYFHAIGGKLYQARADVELEKRQKISEKRAENGRKTTQKPAEKLRELSWEVNVFNGPGRANGTTKQQQMGGTSTSTATKEDKKASKQEVESAPTVAPPLTLAAVNGVHVSRGTRLPPEWVPSNDDSLFAEGLGLDPATVALKYKDHWAGKGHLASGRKSDWPATWRNWCRDDAERRNSRVIARQQPESKMAWMRDPARNGVGPQPEQPNGWDLDTNTQGHFR